MANKSGPANAKRLIPLHLLGMALFCLLAAGLLLAQPSEVENARFLGYSARRLALVAGMVLASLVLAGSGAALWKDAIARRRFAGWLSDGLSSAGFWVLLGLIAIVGAVAWVLYFIPQDRAISLLGGAALYVEQLHPAFLALIGMAALAASLLLQVHFGLDRSALRGEAPLLRLGSLLFGVLLLLWGLETFTGLGLGFDLTEWNAPGAPLLASQVFLMVMLAPVLLVLAHRVWEWTAKRTARLKRVRLDVALFVLVWAVAALLWLRTPAGPTYYSSPPVAPNYEPYPLSDAFNHDVIANNVLIGEGFSFGGLVAIRRPAYVLFLAGLEGLVGAQTAGIVTAQVLVLALFPAVLFALGRALHNRLSGLLLAGLVTLREANSIALGGVINLSHAKLIMADLPAALALAACALAATRWLKSSGRNPLTSLLVGGLFGGALLVRSQVLTVVPVIALLALLAWRPLARSWRPVLLFLAGAILGASPWLLRNRILTGQWIMEDSIVSGFIAQRYSFEPDAPRGKPLPGESEGDFYARNMRAVRDFALANPGYVAGFVADNYVRNLTLTFTPMPLSLVLRDLESHVRQLPFWPSWDGELPAESWLPLFANLFLVGLGLAVAWRQVSWAGLVPLGINLGFALNLALARVSGWRYNLPADWTMLLYYALGLGQLLFWLFLVLRRVPWCASLVAHLQPRNESSDNEVNTARQVPLARLLLAGTLLLVAGLSFSLIEVATHPRYTTPSAKEAAAVLESNAAPQGAELAALLRAGDLRALSGRALYPRYYAAGAGLPGRDFALVDPLDFDRLTFYLIGPRPLSVILPLANDAISLPNAADVLVLVCVSAPEQSVAVFVEGAQPAILSDPNPLSHCFASTD